MISHVAFLYNGDFSYFVEKNILFKNKECTNNNIGLLSIHWKKICM